MKYDPTTYDRRHLLRMTGVAAAAAIGVPVAHAAPSPVPAPDAAAMTVSLRPDSADDQSAALQRAIDQAASARMPLSLAPGVYRAAELMLPPGSQIRGVAGATRLVASRGKPILIAARADHVHLSGLTFDGGGQPLPKNFGLVSLAAGEHVRITDCEFIGAACFGIVLDRIGGEITGCTLLGSADAAIFSIDARGLTVTRNRIRRAGNNGIQIWRRNIGDDGTLVADNTIEEIDARDGGTGQNGNGVNVFRAGGVIVRGNRIRDCVFSAVRGNTASGLRIVENTCANIGEVALYCEFGFEGAIVASNSVDGAGNGLSVTNYNEGGRLAVVQGNIFRNLGPRSAALTANEDHGVGIYVEADTAVTGNVIENAARAGIIAGWGRYLRDVTVTGNVVRKAEIGVGVSVVSGAGAALIANNLISGATRGAILGMEHLQPVTGDLSKDGAARYSQLAVSGNRVN